MTPDNTEQGERDSYDKRGIVVKLLAGIDDYTDGGIVGTRAGLIRDAAALISLQRTQLQAIRKQTVEECAKCVPTNWVDSLLSGKGTPTLPLDGLAVERLLRKIQDRIRARGTTKDGERG